MLGVRSVVLALALALVLVPPAPARADDDERGKGGGFSVRDVQGPTAFAFDGFVNVGTAMSPVFAPAAAIGRFVADGRGRIRDGVRTLSIGGIPSTQTFECTYTVNSNGTGSAVCEVTGGPVPVETFDFVIVQRKDRAFFTGTTPGVTVRGETKRQQ